MLCIIPLFKTLTVRKLNADRLLYENVLRRIIDVSWFIFLLYLNPELNSFFGNFRWRPVLLEDAPLRGAVSKRETQRKKKPTCNMYVLYIMKDGDL